MGKRPRGAKLRAQQRAKAAAEELQEQQAEQAARISVVQASNDDLFVLDTSGAVVPHHEKPSKPKNKKQKGLSEQDQKLVDQLVLKHSTEELKQMAQAGKEHKPLRTRGARVQTATDLDLWKYENPSETEAKHTKVMRKAPVVAVTPADAGQSYQPDPVAYKMAYQHALQVEKDREKALKYKTTPIAQGLSEETKALLVGDSDDEQEDSDADHHTDGPVGDIPKRQNKLTRAQRNAQKRKRENERERQQKLKEKKLKAQLSEVGKFRKELVREEEARKQQRLKAAQKTEKCAKPSLNETLRAPTVPLALKHEVQSSLRRLRPKGSLVQDKVHDWTRTKLVTKRHGTKQYHKRKRSVKHKDEAGDDWVVMG